MTVPTDVNSVPSERDPDCARRAPPAWHYALPLLPLFIGASIARFTGGSGHPNPAFSDRCEIQAGTDSASPFLDSEDAKVVSTMCFEGCPRGTAPDNTLVIRNIYLLSNNPHRKFADWVAYRVDNNMTNGGVERTSFRRDPLLPKEETLDTSAYAGAFGALGVDRGHQAPWADFSATAFAQETNVLSNITPQQMSLNRGPWKQLESVEQVLARFGSVYVFTGPYYSTDETRSLPGERDVQLPAGYWKIITMEDSSCTDHIAAFAFPQNTPQQDGYLDHIESVKKVESLSRLRFFWQQNPAITEADQVGAAQWFSQQMQGRPPR